VRAIDASGCDLVVFPSQEPDGYLVSRPALVSVHDLMHRYEPGFGEYRGLERRSRDRHYRNLCEAAAGILVDSELGKRQVVESYGVPAEKVFPLPYAPSDHLLASPRVDVRAKYGLFERYLFYPAHFWEHKNHLRLLEALATLKARGVAAKLVLCGSRKNAYEGVVRRISELGLGGDVTILGYVPDEDMRSLYEEAVATVFVSLIGPTNIPPLEAMAVGSPLVVSDAYAMPEQVGDAALLVNARDSRDIAAKVERVWSGEATRRALAERGRARSARWTQADFGDRLRSIVSRLVAG
jgi:glycosyltransferase involved in cell wall biosynthesis